jgi:hypothetical protein
MPWAQPPGHWRSRALQSFEAEEDEATVDDKRRRDLLMTFLAELSVQRLYSNACEEAGINEPADFLLFQDEELIDLGFKPAHVKKIKKSAGGLTPGAW